MKFKSFKCRFQQKLYPNYPLNRFRFARTMRQLLDINPNLKFKTIFSNEFLLKSDRFNRQNNRYFSYHIFLFGIFWSIEPNFSYWAIINPRWTRAEIEISQIKTMAWVGVIGNVIIGPYFFPGRSVNSHAYLKMLKIFVIPEVGRCGIDPQSKIFMQDGAPIRGTELVLRSQQIFWWLDWSWFRCNDCLASTISRFQCPFRMGPFKKY